MQPTRRQVLVGGAVLTLTSATACTSRRKQTRVEPSLDDRLRAEAVGREQGLVEAYLAALQSYPELTPSLAPVLGDHAAHLAALGGTTAPAASPAPTSSAAPTRRPRAALVRDLVNREKQAAAAHAAAAERAEVDVSCSRTLAPLLASLAASEAVHAAVHEGVIA